MQLLGLVLRRARESGRASAVGVGAKSSSRRVGFSFEKRSAACPGVDAYIEPARL